MNIAPLPANEQSRLACLYKYDILDTEAEEDFNDIVQMASQICQAPISLISLIDENRQWFKAKLGVDVAETARAPSFCSHALLQGDIMEVTNATEDARFTRNPFVTGSMNIRFYAGMPLTMSDGSRLGTLCVIDHQPRQLTASQKDCLRVLGRQVVHLLELRLKIKELGRALDLVEEQRKSLQKVNEAGIKLLSIIGHDLRSPLVELDSLLQLCEMRELSAGDFQKFLDELRTHLGSALELSRDLLEWASEQFAGGEFAKEDIALAELVDEEIKISAAAFAKKSNRVVNKTPAALRVKANRHALSFIIRNLMLNANKYTEKGKIIVEAEPLREHVRVTITDTGTGLTEEQAAVLFKGSERMSQRGTRGEKGSGLGLQLCREFVQKHGGEIGVESRVGVGSLFYFTLAVY